MSLAAAHWQPQQAPRRPWALRPLHTVNGARVLVGGKPAPQIDIDRVREHLRLDTSEFDSELARLSAAALELLGRYLNRPLQKRARLLDFGSLPERWQSLSIGAPPIASITSVAAQFDDGSVLAINDSGGTNIGAELANFSQAAYVDPPPDGWDFGGKAGSYVAPLEVELVVGFDELPAVLEQALFMIIADFWSNRMSGITYDVSLVPQSTKAIVSEFRNTTLVGYA